MDALVQVQLKEKTGAVRGRNRLGGSPGDVAMGLTATDDGLVKL